MIFQSNGLAYLATRMEFIITSFSPLFPSMPGIPIQLKSYVHPKYLPASPWVGVHTLSMNGFQVTISRCIKIRFISVPEKIYPALIIWFSGSWVPLMKHWMPCWQVNAI